MTTRSWMEIVHGSSVADLGHLSVTHPASYTRSQQIGFEKTNIFLSSIIQLPLAKQSGAS